MKKRALALSLITAIAAEQLCACSDGGENTDTSGAAYIAQAPQEPVEITDDNVMNSVRLFDAMTENVENSMMSPLSLNMVLGMLQSGADGDTEDALTAYLGTENYADFAADYVKVVKDEFNLQSGVSKEYRSVFNIANSLWASGDIPLNEDYKSSVSEKFGAEVENIDFKNANKAVNTINNWVKDKTNKMIPTLLEESQVNADTAAVLVNTVYFESGWQKDWTKSEDTEPFHLFDGTTKAVNLMSNSPSAYYENENATAFGCYYRNGLQFVGILPKESGEFTLESLDIPSLLASESDDYDVFAKMPSVTFESDFPLTEALKMAGLSVIFDEDNADFTKMQANSDERFYISEVVQKTKLELDEKGTKAAAATAAIITNATAALDPFEREQREVILDRPFAFVIYDSNNEQIVFLGKISS